MNIHKPQENIEVIAIFDKNTARPYAFRWTGKKFIVEKINLTYAKRVGRDKVLYYAVSAEGNSFTLSFNANEMSWTMEDAYFE